MPITNSERVLELFSAVLELPPDHQSAFLKREAADDSRVVEEVVSLLNLDREADADGFLGAPALQMQAENLAGEVVGERVGERIGSFKILKLIGSGGMGAIYLAERDDDQYRRQVAIKVIKRGMDTDHVLLRFCNERQILANLNHPNIARLYSGGATADGVPYFVMEFVDGVPINEYADRHQLSINERLSLFRKVCAAVQYAHQNLIVHRDLKPTNILVTTEGEPKLLDFGIAKVLDAPAQTTITVLRALTPEYASPEQIKGELVTTGSDVYSLGVVLYELLTGRRPYAVISDCGLRIAESKINPKSLRHSNSLRSETRNPKSLRSDLDNIVFMALRKEAERRYSSVGEFSEDIQRYLDGRPISARKDTAWYRTSKFVGRHRYGVTAALLVLITLLAGIVGTAWEAHAARIERARAERRFQDVRHLAGSFMFEFHDAIKDLPGALNARQLVVKRALEYLDSLAQEANGDSALQSELAQAYDKVGSLTFDVQQTIESHRKAMLLNEALVKADPHNAEYRKQLSESYNYMSDVMKIAGHSSEAIGFAKKSLSIFEWLALEHPADQNIKALVADRNLTLGIALEDGGDLPNALESDRAAMTIQQELVSKDPSNNLLLADLSAMQSHLSSALVEQGDLESAIEYDAKSFAIVRNLFQGDSTSARYRRSMWASYLNTAKLQLRTGDNQAAVENCARAVQLLEELSSADPKDTGHRVWMAVTYQIYGDALAAAGRVKDAEGNYQQAISIGETLVNEDPARAEACNNLARAYASLARLLMQAQQKRSVDFSLRRAKAGDRPKGDSRRSDEAGDYLSKAKALFEQSLQLDRQNARLRRQVAELKMMANSR